MFFFYDRIHFLVHQLSDDTNETCYFLLGLKKISVLQQSFIASKRDQTIVTEHDKKMRLFLLL